MTERFNSGMGGYTCDCCRTLLWIGFNGRLQKENRKYIYQTARPETIYETKLKAYCSRACYDNRALYRKQQREENRKLYGDIT